MGMGIGRQRGAGVVDGAMPEACFLTRSRTGLMISVGLHHCENYSGALNHDLPSFPILLANQLEPLPCCESPAAAVLSLGLGIASWAAPAPQTTKPCTFISWMSKAARQLCSSPRRGNRY